ncbi:MAG: 3-keto-disaccharide hydrolase [Terriglobia bacterium]
MKISGLAIFALSLALAQPAGAAQAQGRWISLFNGKTLSGWHINGTDRWVVEDGAIRAESTSGKYGYLTTLKTYRNFALRLRFKALSKGNSGLFFHSRITGINPKYGPDIQGMQVEIDPTLGNHTGGIYESGGRGWLMLPSASGEKALKPLGEWNRLELLTDGNHIVTHLNGVKIADYTYSPARFTDGVIGLQIHTGEHGFIILFKDIYIRTQP